MEKENKKILLTGGNGFIGKNILESYLAKKYTIVAPRSYELNLANSQSVNEFFKNKSFDVALHCATKPGHRNAKDTSNLYVTNIKMFENLKNNKDKFKKFINFGSGAIYDTSKSIADAKEENIFDNNPHDDHGRCKHDVLKQIENLDNFVDLNIFGIFGKYEDWEIRFISNAICKAIYGLPITLRQNRVFSYIFVEDLMPILEFFIENKTKYKSYNIVPNKKYELLKLAKIVKEQAKANVEIKVANEGFGKEYTGSNERLKSEMKNLKFTDIKISIKKLMDYYKQNKQNIDINLLLKDK